MPDSVVKEMVAEMKRHNKAVEAVLVRIGDALDAINGLMWKKIVNDKVNYENKSED